MRAGFLIGLVALLPTSVLADPRDRFVHDGTFLVASIDVPQLTDPAATNELLAVLNALEGLLGEGMLPLAETRATGVRLAADVLRAAKVREAFVVAAIDDIRIDYSPLLVCQTAADSDLSPLMAMIGQSGRIATKALPGQLWIGTPKTLQRYGELEASERLDLLDSLRAEPSEKPLLRAVVSPGADSRRVIRELLPALAVGSAKLTGDLLADGLGRVELTLHAGEAPSARLSLTASDEATRQRFAQLLESGAAAGVAWVQRHQPAFADGAAKAAEVLKPTADGVELTIEVSPQTPAFKELLAGVLVPVAQKAREASWRNSKMNSMKQLALAVLNFENSSGLYPGPIVDEGGKPLLSWRVAILPFLDQMALYDRLRLDEPWDSEHNLRVARALPAPFANPSHNELNARGLTTYLRPVYPGSDLAAAAGKNEPIASGKNGTKIFFAPGDPIRQITDGTSNTILIAEVAPEHAVFWTKPADWEVDLENPMAKLRTDQREGFVTAWHDGHAKFLSFKMPVDILRAVITKTGGEVVSYDGSW